MQVPGTGRWRLWLDTPASATRLPPQGFPPRGPLTKPKDPVQGHVLSNVKQGRHGQLVGQSQSGSKIEAVTWGTGGHLVSGTYLGRAKREPLEEKVHFRGW